jgi:hypothetical protein
MLTLSSFPPMISYMQYLSTTGEVPFLVESHLLSCHLLPHLIELSFGDSLFSLKFSHSRHTILAMAS